jgi:hypothetical protein
MPGLAMLYASSLSENGKGERLFSLSLIITYSNGQSYNTPKQGEANIFFDNHRIAWIIII